MKPPARSYDGLPSKGWGPFRCEWYSFCSGHGYNKDGKYYWYDTDCPTCLVGRWHNCWMQKVSMWFHDHHYGLWFWWANRPLFTLKQAYREARKYKNAGY